MQPQTLKQQILSLNSFKKILSDGDKSVSGDNVKVMSSATDDNNLLSRFYCEYSSV